ncbi:adenylate cyclase, class 2 [Saccharopolyspora shandongensis]|uniref:Adenylate cyclase, class 2 n=1 Tax=Saccharopolyspora shandongensis TaxID=418495 RepID=A0A1H3DH97_9PSEU|nr:CYTH domain-containing protein [Saccharopolyspora shandongensis]SDX65862.1 adenylate cyclase, class 2 [Saccharopolyspora shandongensis]
MAVEAELKARVSDPETIRARLRERAEEQVQTYRDRYFDWPSGSLDRQGYEVRVRVVETAATTTSVLTFKEPPVHDSGSKPEHETTLADAEPVAALLATLGLVEHIAFEKHCRNFRLTEHGRDVLATLVHVPELDGTFIEVETIVPDATDVAAGLDAVRAVLDSLGITNDDLTTETYTDAVAARRS